MWKKEMTDEEIEDYFSYIQTQSTKVIFKNYLDEIYKTDTYCIYEDYGDVSQLSFEDFIESIEDNIFSSAEEYIHYLTQHFSEKEFHENDDSLPLMKKIHDEVLESYSDYKRGYTKYLYVYELDYSEFDLKTPKNKKDRIYLGVSYSLDNWGDIDDFSIGKVKPHDKKVVVTEWIAK